MRFLFSAVLIIHASIHLAGAAKSFQIAELRQLPPIPPAWGVVWLLAALLLLGTVWAVFAWPRWWWAIGAGAILSSQLAISGAWADAKYGSLVNLVLLVGLVFGLLAEGPWSMRAQLDADVSRRLSGPSSARLVNETDLAGLPAPLQRYLRLSGVVGRPRVVNVRARMHGRIRSGPDAPWMSFTAEQYNFYDPPARLFYMKASRAMLPFDVFHRYAGAEATMRVRAAAVVPVVRASGLDMTRAETVTMFNDMCVLAPATLLDPSVAWEAVDAHRVRATFTNAGHSIRAELVINEAGELANFWSDDRRQLSPDGKTLRPLRWSTPLGNYRTFGSARLSATGEARWHEPGRDYAYVEIEFDDVQYNVPQHE